MTLIISWYLWASDASLNKSYFIKRFRVLWLKNCPQWSSWVWAGPNLLLTHRTQLRWWAITSVIILHNILISILLADSLLLLASCHAVSYPMERPTWHGTASRASSPETVRNWGGLQSNCLHWTLPQPQELGSGSFCSHTFREHCRPGQRLDCSLVTDFKTEDAAKQCLDL